MSEVRPWPDVGEEGRWAVELFEERLRETGQTPEQLDERAADLRAYAARTDIEEYREATLAMADRYEAAAAARLTANP